MNKIALQSPLGRPLDFRYRSNVLVVVLASLGALAATAYNGLAAIPLASPGWVIGAAAFLAWAIARELDPAHTSSAGLAALVGGLAATVGRPSLFLAFGVLTGARLIAGTVGLPMGRIDAVSVVGIGAVLGLGGGSAVAVPVLITGVLLVGGLRRPFLTSAAIVAAAGTALLIAKPPFVWVAFSPGSLVLLIGAGLAIPRLLNPQPPQCPTDTGHGQISKQRVVWARLAAVFAIVAAAALGGGEGLFAAGAIVGSVIGVATMGLLSDRRRLGVRLAVRSQS